MSIGEVLYFCGHYDITTLHIASGQAPTYQEEMRQEDEGQTIICGRTDNDERVFGFV